MLSSTSGLGLPSGGDNSISSRPCGDALSDLVPEYQVPGSAVRLQDTGSTALVPIEDVDLAWRLLKATLPRDMAAFTSCVEHTWIRTSSTPPLFEVFSWNQHDAVMAHLPPSSNNAEYKYNGFKSLATALHCGSLWTV